MLSYKIRFYGSYNNSNSKSVKERIVLFCLQIIRKPVCGILISQYLLVVMVWVLRVAEGAQLDCSDPRWSLSCWHLKILYLTYKFLEMLMQRNNHGTRRDQKTGEVELRWISYLPLRITFSWRCQCLTNSLKCQVEYNMASIPKDRMLFTQVINL